MCEFSKPRLSEEEAEAAVEFDALMSIQSQFEDVLKQSARTVSLPTDMRHTEAYIRHAVRYSKLSSHDELLFEIDGFVEKAGTAGSDLQKFNSHIGRGVDVVLIIARGTQRLLDYMTMKNSSRGIISSFINDQILAPFQPP